jgi:hypothetical protein
MNTFCLLCGHPIPPERERRNCFTCSQDCKREYRRQKRLERNKRVCKTCGRPKSKRAAGGQGNIVPPLLGETKERTI